MSQFLTRHKNVFIVLSLLLFWRLYLLVVQTVAFTLPQRSGYIGFIPEANFDGKFYITISEFWYRGLDQAFFPLYPVVMKLVTTILATQPGVSGLIVSIASLFVCLLFLRKLMIIDKLGKYSYWSMFFLLFLPASFFLGVVYTESLFLAFVLSSFYYLRKKKIFIASILAALAGATRIIGVFLLPVFIYEIYLQVKSEKSNTAKKSYLYLSVIPLGLLSYMGYLWYKYSDPLLFVHIQPAFGAGRSGGEIVFLPQVLYRYFNIFMTVHPSSLTFFISLFEIITLVVFSFLLYLAYKKGIRKSYILFSGLALYFPTLSGTLSSLPRYALACFVIYLFLGQIDNKYIKIAILTIGCCVESVLAILFVRGYFVS